MKTLTREDKVKQFRDAAGKKTFHENPDEPDVSIAVGLVEELNEFLIAADAYINDPKNEDFRAGLCKEWADVQYVVSQAALYFDIPASEAFSRVHNSNMTKVVEGKVIFREDGKIEKGPNYIAPDMSKL